MGDRQTTTITRLIEKPDGTECLLLRCARLSVIRGPDKGMSVEMDKQRVRVGTGTSCDLKLSDPAVSRDHFELQASDRGYLLRDLNSTNGTLVGGARIQRALLAEATTLTVGETAIRLEPGGDDDMVELPLSRRGRFGGLLGQSPAMRQVFATLEKVAPTDSTVLLEGESGTGKELAAEAVHRASRRREGPFAVVDCGALPRSLIESELFGHERGAFTGAEQSRAGVLEQAEGGTMFLDEVAELPLELQPRLLRFLESQQVKRLGAAQHRRVDARIVAATNRLLQNEVREGRFREDLYFRLSVVRVELPPLRDRPEDVLLLAYHFAESFASDPAELISEEIATLLRSHHWPGNARELRNAIEQIAIAPEQGKRSLQGPSTAEAPAPENEIDVLIDLPFHVARQRWQDRFEACYLKQHLKRADGVVARAASQIDLPRQTVHRLLKKHGLRD